ncbi:LacI family transcriptional regulator [Kribbella sp. VKM Ac-2527]|uniref:LacI family transcriptional regulator n=1 Tax=Kribbella caucasensis TaxID=2512215 RepID=A0A4R6KH61_9ACTN|nr:LacI family DNA-binding transcriptional regulator [Kribbella sp. VKM Ac-2527]TDO48454.1 LacI family transcriptional regulator [Kribbella sp. VKM Ac-2527]
MSAGMSERPTLRTIAAEAGVSIATVSYVLSGHARGQTISDATAERVRGVATRLGYRRNDAARAIRTGKSDLVLLSLNVLADPWSQAVAATVSARVTPLGKTALIVADGDWRTVLSNRTPDVIFIDHVGPELVVIAELEAFAAQGVQIVVFSEVLEPRGFDVVRSGAEPRCHLAVEHLLEKHTRIGALTSENHRPTRFAAYQRSMAAAGLEVRDDDVAVFERHPEDAYRAAMSLLTKADRPTALYCTTDFAAIAAVRAAHRLRLDVPGDVAVIGVGNTPDGEHLDPPLSTVGPVGFNETLAGIIASRLTDREGAPGKVFDFPWQLIVRESTGGGR